MIRSIMVCDACEKEAHPSDVCRVGFASLSTSYSDEIEEGVRFIADVCKSCARDKTWTIEELRAICRREVRPTL